MAGRQRPMQIGAKRAAGVEQCQRQVVAGADDQRRRPMRRRESRIAQTARTSRTSGT
jgi:hypothetical protein